MFMYYLLAKLDDVILLFGVLSMIPLVVSAGTLLVSSIVYFSNLQYGDTDSDVLKAKTIITKICKPILIITISIQILLTLIPSTKQLAFILVAPQIVENGTVKDTVKNIPELTQLGTEYLKELLKTKTEELVK